jgi:thiamine-phosphate pyrophosphorylase
VVVNDRLDVAIACGAAGVHLRGDSLPPAAARTIAPPGFLVGVSVHAVDEAVAAAPSADYLIAGTVWPTRSKPAGHDVIGAEGLARIVAAVRRPVLAIGGVQADRVAEAAAAGAAGVAAIGLFIVEPAAAGGVCRAGALEKIVRDARSVFDTPGSAS